MKNSSHQVNVRVSGWTFWRVQSDDLTTISQLSGASLNFSILLLGFVYKSLVAVVSFSTAARETGWLLFFSSLFSFHSNFEKAVPVKCNQSNRNVTLLWTLCIFLMLGNGGVALSNWCKWKIQMEIELW